MQTREEMIAALERADKIAALQAWDEQQAVAEPTPEPEAPGFVEGRLAGIRGGFNEVVATGADFLSTPGRVLASFTGNDPNKAKVEFAGIPLTDIAEDQRGAAAIERGIQQRATPEGGAAKFGTELLDSAINMAPSIATTIATKKGDLGLGVMSAQVFSTTMTDSLNKGKSHNEALKDAAIATAFEIGPEKAFGFFDNLPIAKGAKQWLQQVVAEAASEATTEQLSITDETFRQGEDFKPKEAFERILKSGAMGAIMGGGFSAPALFGGKETESDIPPDQTPAKSLDSLIQEALNAPEAVETPVPSPTMAPQPVEVAPQVAPNVVQQEPVPVQEAVEPQVPVQEAVITPSEEEVRLNEARKQIAEAKVIAEEEQQREAETQAIEEKYQGVKRPPTLLDDIARQRVRLDRRKFGGDQLVEGNLLVGNKWLFEGENSKFQDEGMGPDELLGFLQENGWIPEDDPNSPSKYTANDAIDLLNSALRGDRIVHPDNLEAELDFLDAQRFDVDMAREAELGEIDVESAPMVSDAYDLGQNAPDEVSDAELEAIFNAKVNPESIQEDFPDWARGPEERNQSPAEGELIPGATPAEQVRAATEQKTADRNRLGEDEVLPEQGEGELFAGNDPGVRPVQTDIEDTGRTESVKKEVKKNTVFTDEAAAEARAYLDSQLGTAFSNPIDPKAYQALVTIAGNKVERGIRTFDAFAREMIKEFGERIRPHLERLWKDSGGETVAAQEPPKPKAPSGPTTSTKNAVTEGERAARNQDPLMREARQSNPELIERAEQAMANNKDLADEIIDGLNNDPEPSISVMMEAILFIKKVDMRREMRRLAEKASEGNDTAWTKYHELLSRQLEIDQATHASGAVWGRLGQLRSRMMNEDYSFEAQALAFAARQGKALSKEQTVFIKQQADKIEDLTARLEEANRKAQDALNDYHGQEAFKQMSSEVQKTQRRKMSVAQTIDARIEQHKKWFEENAFRVSANPADKMFHAVALGGLYVAKGANTLAKFTKAMTEALGDKFFGSFDLTIKELFELSLEEEAKIKREFSQDSIDDLKVQAEALSEIDEELTHQMVYDLARAFVQSGITNENQVMQEVHSVLSEHFDLPGGERDVRRLFSEYGQATFPSQAEDLKRMRELRTLVRVQESIDRLKDNKAPKRTGLQRDKDTQEIREKNRILSILKRRYDRENPTPSRDKLASINDARVTRLENQIADLEKQIKTGEKPTKGEPVPDSQEVTKLKAKRDALKAHLQAIEDAKKIKLTPDEQYNELRGKQLRRDLAETTRRIREKDYAPRTRKEPPPLSEANKALRAALVKAKMDLHEQQAEWLRSKLKPHQKAMDYTSQAINLSRAVMTSIDLSAVLRQGGFKMLANPTVAIKSFVPMIQALQNDANANAVNDEILSRANADLYQKAKLHLSEQDSAHPTKMEEVYMGRWQKLVPGVAASGRAYVTFLNKLRADSFDAGIKYFSRKGQVLTVEEMRQLAAYINNATGRFDISKAGAAAGQGLSNIFFAPRWMLSRFAMLTGQPMWNASPRMRWYIAQEYARYLLGFTTLFGLAALAAHGFDDDEEEEFWQLDPRSTDFGKMRIGNTRMDMMSGLSQPLVFLSRIVSGGKVNQKGQVVPLREGYRFGVPEGASMGFNQDDAGDVAVSFLRSKFAPPLSAAWNGFTGKNVIGQTYEDRGQFLREVIGLPAEIAENPILIEALGLATPLSMRDFYDALLEHGLAPAMALQVLATLGVSMNTYEVSGSSERKGRPERPKRPSRPE